MNELGYRGDKHSDSMYSPPLSTLQAPPVRYRTLDLTIQVLAAQALPLHNEGTNPDGFHPYVKVDLHVEQPGGGGGTGEAATGSERSSSDGKEKDGMYKAKTKTRQGCAPDFQGEELKFERIPAVVPELSFVRFLVRDNIEFARDPLAAWACVRLDRLKQGYRFVHLLDAHGLETEAVVLVKVSMTWT